MSDLVGNPEDRFSSVAAHITMYKENWSIAQEEPGNEVLMDGRTDTQTQIFCRGYNITPHTFSSGGV